MLRTSAFWLLSLLVVVTGCARNTASNVYDRNNTVSKVVRGTIVSARQVTITDDTARGTLGGGAIGGGLAGGIAGSTLGKGDGKTLTALGGAIAGAVIGSMIETQLSAQEATEYVVQLDAAPPVAQGPTANRNHSIRTNRSSSVEDDINSAISVTPTQSELVAVVQSDPTPMVPGQRVLMLYNNDLPRVIADQSYPAATLGPAFVTPSAAAAPAPVVTTPVSAPQAVESKSVAPVVPAVSNDSSALRDEEDSIAIQVIE